MTTLGLGLVFLALLMIYCGVKGKSLSQAVLGHAVDSTSGSLIQGGASTGSASSSPATSSNPGRSASGTTIIAPSSGG